MCVGVCSVAQSCLTLCDTRDYSPSGSSVHEISQQEYWSGLPLPTPQDLPNPRIEPTTPMAPALAGVFFTTAPLGKSSIGTLLNTLHALSSLIIRTIL